MILNTQNKAFTLVELFFIIAIIAIFAGAAISMFIEFHSSSEETIFREFSQDLNLATTQFFVARGRQPKGFGEFVAATQADVDASMGLTVPLMYTKKGEPICGTTAPGPTVTTLVCDDVGLQKKKATYTLSGNVVLMEIDDL